MVNMNRHPLWRLMDLQVLKSIWLRDCYLRSGNNEYGDCIAGAFADSVPLMVIAGQVSTTRQRRNTGCRQIGFQETPIASVFEEITKGVFKIGENSDPIKVMQEAFNLMIEGRPGPVVIEIADDVQRQKYKVDSKFTGRPANGNYQIPSSISEGV